MARQRIRAMALSAGRGRLLLAAPLVAVACAPLPPQEVAAPAPLPLPAPGKATPVRLDPWNYTVIRSVATSPKGGDVLRVYRADPPDFDYAQGLQAKKVAEAYCAEFNRRLAPDSLGMFEPVGDWAFPGGCT